MNRSSSALRFRSIQSAALMRRAPFAFLPCATIWFFALISLGFPQSGDYLLMNKAKAFVEQMETGAYGNAAASFDSTMKAVMPPSKIGEIWRATEARYGPFQKMQRIRIEKVSGYDVVFLTTDFEKMSLDIKVVFNQKGEIAGLFFVPASSADTFQPPSYADADAFSEEDYSVTTGEFKLPGTLAIPKSSESKSIVLLIAGSGPNDRDETIGPNKPLRDIAWGLGSRGIASLRYDKRTKIYGGRLDTKQLTYKEEVVDDAISAIHQLRKDNRFDRGRVFLLGHSLGGQLVPAIVARARSSFLGPEKTPSLTFIPLISSLPIPTSIPLPGMLPFTSNIDLAGAIIMAGSTRQIVPAMIDQLKHIAMEDGQFSSQEKGMIAKFESGVAAMKQSRDASHQPVMGLTWNYLEALNDYDCLKTAQKFKLPLLIAQGERDYQVLADHDFQSWRDALSEREDVTFKLYPNLNHLFIAGEGTSYPAEYEKPGHVSEDFINDLSTWIEEIARDR